MKIVFFGTPEFVIPVLTKLHTIYDTPRNNGLVGVVTQAPKPAGRDKQLTHSPVDNWAFRKKLNLITDINLAPEADLGVCAAYGAIIPQAIIKRYRLGILNVHPSLLPKYRGASPIQSALLAGETETGVTIIKMDELMDHGEIVSSFREKIGSKDTNETLRTRLFVRAADFLIELIPGFVEGKVRLKEQNHKEATYCKPITKADGFVPPQVLEAAMTNSQLPISKINVGFIEGFSTKPDAGFIDRFVRAMDPWPMAWTNIQVGGKGVKRLKILSTHADEGKLVIERVQMEGKGPVTWKQFLEGHPSMKLV